MPKLTGPLFSVEARKQLGHGLTYQRRPGGASVYGYKKPKVPLTFKQVRQRWLVRDAVAWWRALSDADKALWELKAKGRGQSGYSLFMHESTALGSEVYLYLPFYEGGGSVVHDLSRFKSHGTIHGATWAAGLHGKCLDFDAAIPSYVEIPASYTQLDFTSEDFSIICRLKLDTFTGHPAIFMRGTVEASGYFFVFWNTGKLDFLTYQASKSQSSSSDAAACVTATWYTLGMTRKGASVKVLRNGVDITTTSGTHIDPVTSGDLAAIGTKSDKSSQPFDGKMEFLRVFGGVALTVSEHLAWHNVLK